MTRISKTSREILNFFVNEMCKLWTWIDKIKHVLNFERCKKLVFENCIKVWKKSRIKLFH